MKIIIELIPADGSWQNAEEIIKKIRAATENRDEVTVEVKTVTYAGTQTKST